MIRFALVVGGLGVALYYLTGGGRVPVAEGRSWRLVPGGSTINWPKVYPDAVNRLATARARVVVKIEDKATRTRVPVIVAIDGKNGPTSFRGHFEERNADGFTIPSPWGPSDGAPLVFELADVVFIKED